MPPGGLNRLCESCQVLAKSLASPTLSLSSMLWTLGLRVYSLTSSVGCLRLELYGSADDRLCPQDVEVLLRSLGLSLAFSFFPSPFLFPSFSLLLYM